MAQAWLRCSSGRDFSYYCTHFAYAFVAAASSMGYPARHLGIDCEHSSDEGSTHHGVADVWVNCLRKWVALDPNYDAHLELDGVPLNAEETVCVSAFSAVTLLLCGSLFAVYKTPRFVTLNVVDRDVVDRSFQKSLAVLADCHHQ